MKFTLIAVKEGITLFRGGTIFQVESAIQYGRSDGSIKDCVQLPDDGMGRPLLIETKDIIFCGDNELRGAELGHGRCNFSKEEVIGADTVTYSEDFSPRSISLEKRDGRWTLLWRLPNSTQTTQCIFLNKITKEVTTIEADCRELEYDEYSINGFDYKQTLRKRKGLYNIWNIQSLAPGFYQANVDLGSGFQGRIHFIKHYPIQLSNKDPRETEVMREVTFSEQLWNSALKIKLAWGPESRIPFHVRLLSIHPHIDWGQANFLEKICNDALSLIWSIYEKEADGLISLVEVKKELNRSLPWIDEERHAQLRVLGEYYAKLKR